MKIRSFISALLGVVLWYNTTIAQDSIVVISRLSNTQFIQQDSVAIISTLGHFPGGIYQQDDLIISFEPFTFLFGDSGPSAIRDLPAIAGLNVFPNPVTDIAILERATSDEEFILQLYTGNGISVRKNTWTEGSEKTNLMLGDQSPGMYILVVTNADQTKASCFRIVKH